MAKTYKKHNFSFQFNIKFKFQIQAGKDIQVQRRQTFKYDFEKG